MSDEKRTSDPIPGTSETDTIGRETGACHPPRTETARYCGAIDGKCVLPPGHAGVHQTTFAGPIDAKPPAAEVVLVRWLEDRIADFSGLLPESSKDMAVVTAERRTYEGVLKFVRDTPGLGAGRPTATVTHIEPTDIDRKVMVDFARRLVAWERVVESIANTPGCPDDIWSQCEEALRFTGKDLDVDERARAKVRELADSLPRREPTDSERAIIAERRGGQRRERARDQHECAQAISQAADAQWNAAIDYCVRIVERDVSNSHVAHHLIEAFRERKVDADCASDGDDGDA